MSRKHLMRCSGVGICGQLDIFPSILKRLCGPPCTLAQGVHVPVRDGMAAAGAEGEPWLLQGVSPVLTTCSPEALVGGVWPPTLWPIKLRCSRLLAAQTVQLHTCDVSKINWNAPLWLGEATRSGLASAAASVSRALPEASGSSGASGDARGNSGRQQQQQQVGPSSPGTHGSDSSLRGLHKRPGSLHGSRQLLHVEEAAPEALQQQQRQQGQQVQQHQQNQGHGRLDLGTDATLLSMPHARVDDVCEGTSRSLSGERGWDVLYACVEEQYGQGLQLVARMRLYSDRASQQANRAIQL